MKKAGKTTRPFRYDLNQIPYDYTVEVTNRFKGLDLIDGVSEEIWIEEVSSDQYHAQEKEMQKGKMFAVTRPYKQLRKEVKGKGEKVRYSHLNVEFQRIASRDKKVINAKK